ncbi:MAG TPA: acyl-CoA dehydrogenase family protein [Rhizomicrobium sp.]|nr:acyl-CoA dehydrogenase family protein [Rhizomicrobium sp.]
MNFDFSDEERAAQETLRRMLAAQCDRNFVRRVLDGEHGLSRELWRELGWQGWLSTSVPEQYGGQGLGYVLQCAIALELGRALAPVPFWTSFLVSEALLLAGSEDQKRRYLPALARGELVGTVAFAETAGGIRGDLIAAISENGRLTGSKTAVCDGTDADVTLVAAKADGEVHLFLVDLHGAGITRAPQTGIDPTKSLARIDFTAAPAEQLGDERAGGWPVLESLLARTAVLVAFEQLGGAEAALVMARDYALDRHTFGRPVGAFQAIKHKLADIYIANELARSNAYFAAWALNTNSAELPLAAATAHVSATEAFDRAARDNIQVHGGAAIAWQHDCQLFYRRARHLALALGAPGQWRARVVANLAAARAA